MVINHPARLVGMSDPDSHIDPFWRRISKMDRVSPRES
jgi:hypothetical protein